MVCYQPLTASVLIMLVVAVAAVKYQTVFMLGTVV
jgi:hypothetical protein